MSIQNLSEKQKQAIYMIVGLLVITLLAITAIQLYKSNSNKQLVKAATSYQKAIITNENPDIKTTKKITSFETVATTHPATSYGIFASWELAHLYTNSTKATSTNSSKAIQILQQSIAANPKDDLTNITKTRLVKLYLDENQADKAIKVLQSITNLQKNAYPLLLLGQAYLQQNDKTKAIQTWQKAEQDSNSSPEFKETIAQLINNAS